jgi:hypothetical protein
MFCWDSAWQLAPGATRLVAQGLDTEDSPYDYVPCGLRHHGSCLSAEARVARLAHYWFAVLRPQSPVWRPPDLHHAPPLAPWREARAEPPWDAAAASGASEQAWADLDRRVIDPELEWT